MLSRREVLTAFLGAPLGAALSAVGCNTAPAARAPLTGGFVEPSMRMGHTLRAGRPSDDEFASAPTRSVRVAIVGGGPSGLSAGWQLQRQGITDFTLLELEPKLGGTSVSGATTATGFPWGAHYITTPLAEHTDLIALLHEMNALERTPSTSSPHPTGREELLVRELKERTFYKGFFYPGLYLRVGASRDDLAQLERFEAIVEHYAALRDAQGRRAFAIPVDTSSDDPELLQLDTVSALAWLRGQKLDSPRLLHYLEYGCRDDYGLTLANTSAWALLFYYASRKDPVSDHESEIITWPEGNGALVAHLGARFKDRVQTGKLVVDVVPQADRTHVFLLDAQTQKPERIIAERVIVATPRFITTRIVRPLRDQSPRSEPPSFAHGAWLVANLQLKSRPISRGASPAWDNVLYDSPSLGYVCATHQRGRDFGATVFTYYLPMTDDDPRAGRERLQGASFEQLAETVCSDLERAHSDLREHITRVELCRFGHGMVQPRVGHVWSRERRAASTPLQGIHFAHSDLSSIALFEEAFHHGVRAAREVAAVLV